MDGCRAGWVAAFVRPAGDEARLSVVRQLADVTAHAPAPAIVAVDVPIGLPQRASYGGREAENAVRPLLGERQSSVFSVPSRAAIYAGDYREACRIALATSDPPRKVSKQLYMIAPKIREVDALLRSAPDLAARVFECHPELAFWRLNDNRQLPEPKKMKGRPYEPGLALRRQLLRRAGLSACVTETAAPPPGRGQDYAEDDVLDALACAVIARRLHLGIAEPFPNPPPRDAFGLPMAIWA